MKKADFNLVLKKSRSLNLTTPETPVKTNYVFTSLFSPGTFKNLSLYYSGNSGTNSKMKKILLKQSYLLIAWFKYASYGKNKSASIFILPVRTEKTTKIKAPMAHKTFSQEQYLFKLYKVVLSNHTILTNKLSFKSYLATSHNLNSTACRISNNMILGSRAGSSIYSSDQQFFTIE